MIKKILICTILVNLNCSIHPNYFLNPKLQKQHEYRFDNEITNVIDNSYLNYFSQNNLNLRHRILPYLISKNEFVETNDLLTNHKLVIHYDNTLFSKLNLNNMKFSLLTEPFYLTDIVLKYTLRDELNESYFPISILMFNSEVINHNLTTRNGMQLFVNFRLSIFDSNGNEVAYCQKHLIQNSFTNDFISNVILEKDSPFLSDLNLRNDLNNNNNILFKTIDQCKKELF